MSTPASASIARGRERAGLHRIHRFTMLIPFAWIGLFATVTAFGVTGPVAVGTVLMVISPGAPMALRRALDAGGDRLLAPALHLLIVTLAVLTVPASIAILDRIFAAASRAEASESLGRVGSD